MGETEIKSQTHLSDAASPLKNDSLITWLRDNVPFGSVWLPTDKYTPRDTILPRFGRSRGYHIRKKVIYYLIPLYLSFFRGGSSYFKVLPEKNSFLTSRAISSTIWVKMHLLENKVFLSLNPKDYTKDFPRTQRWKVCVANTQSISAEKGRVLFPPCLFLGIFWQQQRTGSQNGGGGMRPSLFFFLSDYVCCTWFCQNV